MCRCCFEFFDCDVCCFIDLFLYASVLDVVRCADVVLSSSIVMYVALLTCFCMLRYWTWYVVPIWVECLDCGVCCFIDLFLYALVLDVEHCADCCSVTATRLSTCGARLRGYIKFCSSHFGSALSCQYRSIQARVSNFLSSTIDALCKKRPRGVQRGAALCPFAVFSHSNVN